MQDLIKKCLPTYEIVDKIGEGIHGSVFRVKDQFKERAVKIVPIRVERSRLYKTENDLDSKVSQDFHAVREYYETIKGEGVISVYDFHLVEKRVSKKEAEANLVILMELCPLNLQDYVIDNFPLPMAAGVEFMRKLAMVLERLSHGTRNSFLLTDFKPSNLLISEDGRLMIGDLGGLKRLSSVSTIANAQFTPNWSAPELVLKGERPSLLSAIYSYGLVSYYIWEGQLPYEENDFIERLSLIKENGIPYDNEFVPDGVRELVFRCMEFDPENRPENFIEILDCLATIENQLDEPVKKGPVVPPAGKKKVVNDDDDDKDYSATMDMGVRTKPSASSSRNRSKPVLKSWQEPKTRMDFVWVDGGSYKMGCLDMDPDGMANEKPAHEVDLQGFWISRYLVTQEQWKLVMGNNPSRFIKTPEHPVEQVSWDEAQRFLIRMNASVKSGFFFHLPSEMQWEYAARSRGKDELYAGSMDIDDVAWYKENSNHSTQPVGLKKPNGLEIYDMCGNVMEWCEDVFDDEAYKKIKQKKPGGLSHGMERVVRGGGYNLDAKRCRATARRRMSQGLKYVNLGFRVAMTESNQP